MPNRKNTKANRSAAGRAVQREVEAQATQHYGWKGILACVAILVIALVAASLVKEDAGDTSVPAKATDVLAQIQKSGTAPFGYKGGGAFLNDGRSGTQVLPKVDASGVPVTYREFDVNPLRRGVNRGAERIVLGSDGKAYYTGDHYNTFTPMQ